MSEKSFLNKIFKNKKDVENIEKNNLNIEEDLNQEESISDSLKSMVTTKLSEEEYLKNEKIENLIKNKEVLRKVDIETLKKIDKKFDKKIDMLQKKIASIKNVQ